MGSSKRLAEVIVEGKKQETTSNSILFKIAKSWATKEGIDSTEDLLSWIHLRNDEIQTAIQPIALENCAPWYYDACEGSIHNQNRSFFAVKGFRELREDGTQLSQPIIIQQEIGYLGILCHEINGVMHFLMQAKIEPGNVNKIQLSPTIQATKSNFTQKHGGAKPPYLEYFLNASQYRIVVDQIQSEQSSRFYKKRNRNIIIYVEEEVEALPSHRWMTLGQIKQLMRQDNLVNMDTRTVLSCIPLSKLELSSEELLELSGIFPDKQLFRSVFSGVEENLLPNLYQYINNRKMFDEAERVLVPLHELSDWEMRDNEYVCKHPYPFKVIFCDISIEGREVRHWTQPLFEANGIATFGLLCCEDNGILKFLVHAKPEVGCFDFLELGPTIQQEAVSAISQRDVINRFFFERLESKRGVVFDHLLSEEGGRFYHEQNRNVLLRIDISELPILPEGYFLMDFKTLNELVQINNTMNIQLRNLLSLLEV